MATSNGSLEFNNRIYKLTVGQQPVRARMCGFGDKDRRPITPPPCVLLQVFNAQTKQEIPVKDVDCSCFVMLADLYDQHMHRETNLVKHSNNSPAMSISAAEPSSWPPKAEPRYLTLGYPQPPPSAIQYAMPPIQHQQHHHIPQYQQQPGPSHSNGHSAYPPPPPVPAYQPQHSPTYANGHAQIHAVQHQPVQHHSVQHHPVQHHPVQHHSAHPQPYPYPDHEQQMQNGIPTVHYQHPNAQWAQPQPAFISTPPAPGTLTRNLIGSSAVRATKLYDNQKKQGIWFVFQDLSVRTEGEFTLKFEFIDVMDPIDPLKTTKEDVPILASIFSHMFTVYSAKKFPGVIESTNLSKAFANQGVKIPIRKDGSKSIANADDFAGDDADPSLD